MNLLLENGQLLKPYSLPWSPHGWPSPPADWTPDRTTEMRGQFVLLQAEQPDAPDFLLWKQIEKDEGRRLRAARRPWPGWVMVPHPKAATATREDRRISRAYKALFVKLNPQHGGLVAVGKRPPEGAEVQWPPDGRYRLQNGKMTLVEMPVSLGNRSPLLVGVEGIGAEAVRARIEELENANESNL